MDLWYHLAIKPALSFSRPSPTQCKAASGIWVPLDSRTNESRRPSQPHLIELLQQNTNWNSHKNITHLFLNILPKLSKSKGALLFWRRLKPAELLCLIVYRSSAKLDWSITFMWSTCRILLIAFSHEKNKRHLSESQSWYFLQMTFSFLSFSASFHLNA